MLYAAKCYWPGVTPADLQQVAGRAAATSLDTGTGPVIYLGCLLFAADDLVLCLFCGPSRTTVIQASDRLGIPRERFMDSAWLGPHRRDPGRTAEMSGPRQKHDRVTTTSPRQSKQASAGNLNGAMTMNVVCRRIRLGGSAAVAAGAFLLALVPVTAAQAAGPDQFKGSEPISFTDTTTCSFPIAVNVEDSFVGRAFLDAQGNILSITIEQNIVGTESANGITLPTSSHYVEFLSTGAKQVGLGIKIQNGGVVIRDAGYISSNPDGSVAFTHGPQPVLEGDTAALCTALS